MSGFAHLESAPDLTPRFPVQAPDGQREWMETGAGGRQATFITLMHRFAPRVEVHHISNEGKRSPFVAKRSGIVSGVFDNAIYWRAPLSAHVELKGYDKRGRPGQLSDNQVAWGNRMHDLGHHAACFFCPYAAVGWLSSIGFPIRKIEK